MTRHAHMLLTTFGLGHMPIASGTWGSLPPPAIAWGLILLGLGPVEAPILYHAVLGAIILLYSWACVAYGTQAETRWGKKDPGQVVADETAGQCIPLLFLPWPVVNDPLRAAATIGCLFIAFRLFDIVKPWPAGRLQALPRGWGIVVDDLIVGVQLAILAQIILRTLF
jgi:phosphatidylglycerophosphatase A